MKTKPFLIYPIIIFLILFLFDKIFLFEKIKSYIKSDFTNIYYETREDLFLELTKRKSEKKLMIILGSSRLLYFNHQELLNDYPNIDIYNFSSAVTTPAYYYYFLEKILTAGIKPDYLVVESDPNQFNLNSPVFKNSNLTYSFSPSFIFKYATIFGKDLVSFYLAKSLFASSKNKPYLDVAYKRFTNPTFQILINEGHKLKEILIQDKGHSKNLIGDFVEKDFGILEATSERTISWLFSNYKESEMQYYFYEKILQDLKSNQLNTVFIWPQSSLSMQTFMRENPSTKIHVQSWKEKIDKMNQNYGYELFDLGNSDEYYCNSFVDGGHFSKDCYKPTMRFIMDKLYLRKKN